MSGLTKEPPGGLLDIVFFEGVIKSPKRFQTSLRKLWDFF